MSSNSGLHALWSRASKRVPGVEAGQVGLEETSPGTKPQPAAPEDTSDEKLREKSAATAGFVQMADMQRDIPLMTGDNDKGQATGRKRKKASGPQAGSKRSKQNSIWTYPATPAEEEKLLELVEEEQSLLLEDLKHEAPLTIASQSTLDTTGLRRSIAEQIEESSLPYSSLAQTVFEKIAAEGHSTTPAAVRSAILSLAERVNYGAQNADADVLEDNAVDSCWKWEVRDVKLLAESIRDEILDRRKCRRKVSDRLTSLEGFATVLTNMHSDAVGRKGAFTEAAASLKKLDDRGAIVLFAEDLARKREAKKEARDAKSAAKEAERAAKAQEKEQQKLDKETEKEKQKAEKEAERLKLKEEKDRERAEKEAEKERARAEKEAQRQEKEAAREKEELEKDKLRAEREALEQKKKAQIKKSASIMDRFVIKRRPSDVKPEQVPQEGGPAPSPRGEGGSEGGSGRMADEMVCESEIVKEMDKEFAEGRALHPAELKRCYVESFREARPKLKQQPRSHWCIRKTPKKSVQNAIRLAGDPFSAMRESKAKAGQPESAKGKGKVVVDVSDDDDDMDEGNDVMQLEQGAEKGGKEMRRRRYKLLQLGEMGKTCNRPPYYGTWSKRSTAVTGRRPLGLDPDLDYEVDSDEEWEEEDPGESLSSSDKEDNEEEDKHGYGSEDEEDGFVVPSGYLSEDEGVELDSPAPSPLAAGDSPPIVDEHLATVHKLQRKLEKATKVALRTSKPLIVSALLPPSSGDQVAGHRGFIYEGNQAFLQAMTVHVLRSDLCIEVPAPTPTGLEKELIVPAPGEGKKVVHRPRGLLPDEKLPELIEFLVTSTHGMAKNVEVLSTKFPGVSKKHLEQRIREIADYEGGRWQVKASVLAKHGINLPQPTPLPNAAHASGQEETPKPRPTPRILPITKFFTKVSSRSNHSGKSQENSKEGQSEKSPCEPELEQRGSQEAKSELQP